MYNTRMSTRAAVGYILVLLRAGCDIERRVRLLIPAASSATETKPDGEGRGDGLTVAVLTNPTTTSDFGDVHASLVDDELPSEAQFEGRDATAAAACFAGKTARELDVDHRVPDAVWAKAHAWRAIGWRDAEHDAGLVAQQIAHLIARRDSRAVPRAWARWRLHLRDDRLMCVTLEHTRVLAARISRERQLTLRRLLLTRERAFAASGWLALARHARTSRERQLALRRLLITRERTFVVKGWLSLARYARVSRERLLALRCTRAHFAAIAAYESRRAWAAWRALVVAVRAEAMEARFIRLLQRLGMAKALDNPGNGLGDEDDAASRAAGTTTRDRRGDSDAEAAAHDVGRAYLNAVARESSELSEQIVKLRALWPDVVVDVARGSNDDGPVPIITLPRDRFFRYFGGDPNEPLLHAVTDLDVFVDVALQILRVGHMLEDESSSRAMQLGLDDSASLTAIRHVVRDAKATLVDVADTFMPIEVFVREDFEEDFDGQLGS